MKVVLVITFLLCFDALSKQDFFVQVSSVASQEYASYMIKRLKSYGFTAHSKKEKGKYKVYAGPFKTKQEADTAVQTIIKKFSKPQAFAKKVIPYPRKAKQKKSKSDTAKKSPEQTEVKYQEYPVKEHKGFVGINFGGAYVHIDDSNENSGIPIASEPDKDGLAYEVEAGYYFTNNFFATLNYQRTTFDNVDFDNGFSSFNYRFNKTHDIYPYLGVIAGYSRMQWSKNPISALSSDEESFSFIGGGQIGAEMFMLEDLSLYVFYRFLLMEHTTKISVLSEEKEFTHDSLQNLNVGFRYNF